MRRPRSNEDSSPQEVSEGDPLVRLRGVSKQYATLDRVITAVDRVDLDIPRCSVTAVTGPSGSGKSTLLHLIGALERPDTGSIRVGEWDLARLSTRQAALYRRTVGFVFQRFNLLPQLTVLDNVLAPVLPRRTDWDKHTRARELLDAVGLADRENTLATRLSGGQQQRVALARALVARPQLLLADEPTGNLDSTTSGEVLDLILSARSRYGTTVLIATHDPTIAARADRHVSLRDGRVNADSQAAVRTRPGTADLEEDMQ